MCSSMSGLKGRFLLWHLETGSQSLQTERMSSPSSLYCVRLAVSIPKKLPMLSMSRKEETRDPISLSPLDRMWRPLKPLPTL